MVQGLEMAKVLSLGWKPIQNNTTETCWNARFVSECDQTKIKENQSVTKETCWLFFGSE